MSQYQYPFIVNFDSELTVSFIIGGSSPNPASISFFHMRKESFNGSFFH